MPDILFQDDQSSYRKIQLAAAAQAVGVAQVAVPHKLATTPAAVIVEMTSAGQIWQSQAADAASVYLTADAANRTCNVRVIG